MDRTCENDQSPEVGKIKGQISVLENQFVDVFVNGGQRDQLRQIHLQIQVLQAELQLKWF